MEPVTFEAYLPEIQSAVKIGAGEMRVTLVVSETHLPAALPLVGMRAKVLRVTVEVVEDGT